MDIWPLNKLISGPILCFDACSCCVKLALKMESQCKTCSENGKSGENQCKTYSENEKSGENQCKTYIENGKSSGKVTRGGKGRRQCCKYWSMDI